MLEIYKLIGKISKTNINVLVLGESGTGKEVIARMIHKQSARRERPFIPINMAAIPNELLESELFGHEKKGSFTGSVSDKKKVSSKRLITELSFWMKYLKWIWGCSLSY